MLVVVSPENQTGFRKHLEELKFCSPNNSKFITVSERGPESLQKILEAKPDFTIIGARNWIKRNHDILDQIPGKKALLFVGPLGQDEISVIEIENLYTYLQWLDEGKIDYLFMGSKDLTDRFNREDIVYVPAPFAKDIAEFKYKEKPKIRRVSILNDMAIHKNILNSVAGISVAKKVEEFVFNGARKEYIDLFERFGLRNKMTNVGFLERDAYNTMIEESKLLIHISYTEGLCYAALEALYRGTPVLMSNAMPWFYHPLLHVNNPADHQEIANKIDTVLSMQEDEYKQLCFECRAIAEKKIEKNNTQVKEIYNKLGIHNE